MKNVTDFRKTVETGVDPHLMMVTWVKHSILLYESFERKLFQGVVPATELWKYLVSL